jgi:hypothetical protein
MSQLDPYKEYEIPWEKADLFFLRYAVKVGMSSAKIAGFLGRNEAEVREKVRALKLGGARKLECPSVVQLRCNNRRNKNEGRH